MTTAASRVRTYKYRARPTPNQIEALEAQLAFACDLYNAALEERRQVLERAAVYRAHGDADGKRGKPVREWRVRDTWNGSLVWRWTTEPPCAVGHKEQSRGLTEFRQAGGSFPPGMAALVQHDVLRRLEKAYAAFFAGLQAGRRVGPPRYRSRSRYDSLTFQLTTPTRERFDKETGESLGRGVTSGAGTFRDGVLRLTGIGELQLEQHRDMPEDAIPRTATVMRSCGRWYVAISAELPVVDVVSEPLPAVGLDMGVITFCTAFTAERNAALALSVDLKRMATDTHDRIRLWAAERHAQRLRAAATHYLSLGERPPHGSGATMARRARQARRRHARVVFRLRQIEMSVEKLRARLAATGRVASLVQDEAGAAVLIEGAHAGPRHAKRVARTQRRVARRTKHGHAHSHRRKKAVRGPGGYARAKERERNARKDHRHKVSRALVRQFGEIKVEDLTVRQMTVAPQNDPTPDPELPAGVKRRLNNRILDQAWHEFRATVAYKAEDAGGRLSAVPAEYTTQSCARCGTLVPKPPTLRVHRCPGCGYTAPRTVNSARNVLQHPLEQPGRAGPSGANRRGSPHAVA